MIANVNRDPKKRSSPFTANDWDPYYVPPDPGTVPFDVLKIFVPSTPKVK